MTSMPRSRRSIQKRIHKALCDEIGKMDLPEDGVHLARTFRALLLEALSLMEGVPDEVTAHVILGVLKKKLKTGKDLNLAAGLFGSVTAAKA